MSESEHGQLSPLKDVFEELSREAEQEQAAIRSEESYLSNVNTEHLITREREYRDPEKHWVRTKWLKCAQDITQANNQKLTYLTLPAYHRIDVSLFNKHGLLKGAEGSPGTLAVAAFETDPTKFARMSSQTPKLKLFGQASLEDVIVDPKNKYYAELNGMFPFDIVNFDLTTSLTPQHEGPYSRVMQALEETLRRQAAHGNLWGLFLTFRNVEDEWEKMALKTFLDNLQHNIDHHPNVRESFANKYQVLSAAALADTNSEAAITQSVVKWLVDRAHEYNIELVKTRSYHYVRYNPKQNYVITKLIVQFRRGRVSPHVIPTKGTPRQPWMDDDLTKCIAQNNNADVEEILGNAPDRVVDELQQEIEELVRSIDEGSRLPF